jgi:hypothetical protein
VGREERRERREERRERREESGEWREEMGVRDGGGKEWEGRVAEEALN